MKSKLRLFLVVFISVAASGLLMAQGIIRDLSYDWIGYDHQNEAYFPIDGNDDTAINFIVDTKKYADYHLHIQGQGEGSILVNDKLTYYSDSRNSIDEVWSIDSLSYVHGIDSLFITIHELENIRTRIVRLEQARISSSSAIELINLQSFTYETDKNTWIVLLLLSGLLIGIYRSRFPKLFSDLFDLRGILRWRLRQSVFYEIKVFQPSNLFIYALYGFLFVLFYSKNQIYIDSELVVLTSDIYTLILVFIIGFLSCPLKYVIINFFAVMFGLSAYSRFHYMEFIRLTFLGMVMVVLMSFTPLPIRAMLSPDMLLIALLLISISLLFIKLLSNSVDKKLYLFSYICTTEIIPLLFIIKVFI